MVEKVRLLYISGCGRSGSTLLERILGEIEGVTSVGELGLIWKRSFLDNQLCSCGASFEGCIFWKKIVTKNFGNISSCDSKKILSLQQKVMRTRYIPMLFAGKFPFQKGHEEARLELTNILGNLYEVIQKEAQAELIVDSSKLLLYALLLSNVKNIELNVVHLVRNSQAVAYSLLRKRIRPEITNHSEFMPRYSPYQSSMYWNKVNWLSTLLRKKAAKYFLLRYEDFVAQPREKTKELLSNLEIEAGVDFIKKDNSVSFRKDYHSVSGNPMRFRTGEIQIRADNEWEHKLSVKNKCIVRVLTYIFAKKNNY
jgi:hypothetical protein